MSAAKHEWPWLSLRQIAAYEAEARRLGVSEVARGRGGFLPAFKRAGGDPRKLSDYWWGRRQDFVARHMAQARARDEAFLHTGELSRRHLALIMWAYSPKARRGHAAGQAYRVDVYHSSAPRSPYHLGVARLSERAFDSAQSLVDALYGAFDRQAILRKVGPITIERARGKIVVRQEPAGHAVWHYAVLTPVRHSR